MDRNALGAWWAYRALTAPPTVDVSVVRKIREGWRTATNWITILSVMWLVVPPFLNLCGTGRVGADDGAPVCAISAAYFAVVGLPAEVLRNWQLCLTPALLLAAMVMVNRTLESRIKDAARALWKPHRLPLQSRAREG